MKYKKTKESGQVIVELMVATSIMMIGLLGVFATLSKSLALNRIAANQYIASNLAVEGVEVVKNLLDANAIPSNNNAWNEGIGNGEYGIQFDTTVLGQNERNNSDKELKYDPSMGYNYAAGEDTKFIRVVTISNSPDEISVTSRVEWIDRGGIDFEMEVEDKFTNWRKNLNP